MAESINPNDFIITRKRKLYKFAVFQTMANCYDDSKWTQAKESILLHKQPITVEIGAGSGLFLTELAKRHPERQFIAIDRKSDRLYQGAKQAIIDKLDNIVYLWSNASNLKNLLPISQIQTIWLTFPDPWPQESNIKHRLTNPQFLTQYHQLLTPTGRLNFKTDNRELFDWSVQQFGHQWTIDIITHNLHANDQIDSSADARVMTSYEKRYVGEGKSICYLQARPKQV